MYVLECFGDNGGQDTNTREHHNNTSYTSEHKRICKHRPNEDCTHYQKHVGKSTEYLKLENGCWSMLSSKGEWWVVDSKLVKFLIDNPVAIDKSIKKKFKYSWSGVPRSVKWIATSESGFAFGYESKPSSGYLHSGFWYGGGKSVFVLWSSENQFNGTNWRDSLEERPLYQPCKQQIEE